MGHNALSLYYSVEFEFVKFCMVSKMMEERKKGKGSLSQ